MSGVGIIIVGSRVEPRHGQNGTNKQGSPGTVEKRGAALSDGEGISSSEIGQSLQVEGDHNSQVLSDLLGIHNIPMLSLLDRTTVVRGRRRST